MDKLLTSACRVLGAATVVVLLSGLAAQADTFTEIIDLGPLGGGGTNFNETLNGGLIATQFESSTANSTTVSVPAGPSNNGSTWIPAGTLPLGSTLEQVSINAEYVGSGTSSGDDLNFVAKGAPGLDMFGYQITFPQSSTIMWNGNHGSGFGATVIDTVNAVGYSAPGLGGAATHTFPAGIDLHGADVDLADDYGSGTWSGSVSITYDIPAGFSGLTWRGADGTNPTHWTTASVLNWSNSLGSTVAYSDGSAVLFDDTAGTGSHTVSISDANVSPASVLFNHSAATTYTLTGPNGIAGSASLTLAGGGLLIVSNTNSYSGVTNISDGTLQLGNVNAVPLGSGASAVQLGSLGVLDLAGLSPTFNGLNGVGTVTSSVSGAINLTLGDGDTSSGFGGVLQNGSGTLALTKIGNGTLILSTANTYSGGTTINAGTIQLAIQGNSALGTGPVTVNSGGTLYLIENNISNPLVLNGGTLFGTDGYGNSWNGPITLSGTSTVIADYDITFSNVVSGSGGLIAASNHGQLSLSASNTFTGATTVSGILALTNSAALSMSTLDTSDSGTLKVTSLAAVTLGGLSGPGTTTISGSNLALSVGNNNDDTTFSGSLTSAVVASLTKTGTGSLTLSGINTYSGGTNVPDGTLVLDGAAALLAGSSLTIGSAPGSGGGIVVPGEVASPQTTPTLAPVPEPGTFTLFVVCAIAIGLGLWQRESKQMNVQ